MSYQQGQGSAPQYGQPAPNYMPPQQQPKKSRRWIWIILGIVGGFVLLSCGICTFK